MSPSFASGSRRCTLPALAGGLILGVLSVHIVIARPLMSRVAGMQQNMAEINKQMLLPRRTPG